MSDIQKEAACSHISGRIYQSIEQIFDSLPERFTLGEAMRAARIKKGMQMYAVISTLERRFKCFRNANGIWIKPEAVQ